MMPKSIPVLHPFILSWNLRNIVEKPSMFTPDEFCIAGTCLAEYPIDAWKTYYVEIPRNKCKKDIVGRTHQAFGTYMKNTKWDYRRIIYLPIYTHSQHFDIEKLKLVIRYWKDLCISEDIPCLALAVKCRGYYSEGREAQSVTALMVWDDSVARVISLDWTEGPLEDCITPEWYIETSPLLNLSDALEKMKMIYRNVSWDSTSFSIFTIPSCQAHGLRGDLAETSYTAWNPEWRYSTYHELKGDLSLLLSQIRDIFFNGFWRSDMYG